MTARTFPLYRLGLYGVISVDSLDEYGQWEMRRGGSRRRDSVLFSWYFNHLGVVVSTAH